MFNIWLKWAKSNLLNIIKKKYSNTTWCYFDFQALSIPCFFKKYYINNKLIKLNGYKIIIKNNYIYSTILPLSINLINNNYCQLIIKIKEFYDQYFDYQYQNLQNYSNNSNIVYIEINSYIKKALKLYMINSVNSNFILLIKVKNNISLCIEELFMNKCVCYINYINKIQISSNCKLIHIKKNNRFYKNRIIYSSFIEIMKKSIYLKFSININCLFLKELIKCILKQIQSKSFLYNINYISNNNYYCNVLDTFHKSNNTFNKQKIFSIINHKSIFNFLGKIYIPKNIKTIISNQFNKNIFYKLEGKVFTIPELRIYSDDILCCHGAIISKISKENLYYMKSKGICKKNTEKIIILGFIYNILNNLKLPLKIKKKLLYYIFFSIN